MSMSSCEAAGPKMLLLAFLVACGPETYSSPEAKPQASPAAPRKSLPRAQSAASDESRLAVLNRARLAAVERRRARDEAKRRQEEKWRLLAEARARDPARRRAIWELKCADPPPIVRTAGAWEPPEFRRPDFCRHPPPGASELSADRPTDPAPTSEGPAEEGVRVHRGALPPAIE
jgi:hypothetical protein